MTTGPLCEGTIKDIEDLEAPYSFPSPPLQHKNVSSFAADRDEPSIVCPLHAFRYHVILKVVFLPLTPLNN